MGHHTLIATRHLGAAVSFGGGGGGGGGSSDRQSRRNDFHRNRNANRSQGSSPGITVDPGTTVDVGRGAADLLSQSRALGAYGRPLRGEQGSFFCKDCSYTIPNSGPR